MSKVLKIDIGDRVRLKKAHPCGSSDWEVIRTGADIKIRCLGCGRIVMLPRLRFERRVREFLSRANEPAR
jgi:hypothetical protein